MEYKMNVEELLDEVFLEPYDLKIGDEAPFFLIGTDENEIGPDNLGIIESIEKVSEQKFKITMSIKNKINSRWEFFASKGENVELAAITSADCMLGFSIDGCLCRVTEIDESGIQLEIIGIKQ